MNPQQNISEEQLARIERFLSDAMNPDERSEFEQELQQSDELQDQVEWVQQLSLGIESAVLKEQMDQYHDEMATGSEEPSHVVTPNVPGNSYRRWYSIAAAIIVALGIFWYLQPNDLERTFDTYYEPDPGLPTTMSTNNNFEFYDAMVDYKKENYKLAISKWEPLLENDTENDSLQYFIGAAYLANGDEKEAINYLETLLEQEQNSFKTETHFHLGMAYLKAGNVELAKKYLTFSNTEKAQLVLSELTND